VVTFEGFGGWEAIVLASDGEFNIEKLNWKL
jgi:hypothetical protein